MLIKYGNNLPFYILIYLAGTIRHIVLYKLKIHCQSNNKRVSLFVFQEIIRDLKLKS